ncbi:hypothetical protein KFL_001790300 [Klebsormidium nitens]|uniref:Uncharacterized protein n=1 Tax=Klebsormidium nitens TaxID=105231 RepID=A0A1Y1HZT1_KLENI|nr:hypothetical protein KFL_001790300 [Klebsormidium nitens]|eukprot:GAQ84190.1 hypothetical protein KFL_001790300 [Klebsormidium nitens]
MSALVGSVTPLTGGVVEYLDKEGADRLRARGGPTVGLAGGLESVRSLFTSPEKQSVASQDGAMEKLTTTQKLVTTQRQPMMKDVNINVTISIPTGVHMSAAEESEQSTVIRESVVKSFQAAAAPVHTISAAQTAPPAPAKSNPSPTPVKKPDAVKPAEPVRPKPAGVVPPIRKGSKVPLPQVGIGLVALAGLYALHKGLSGRRRETPRRINDEANQASGEEGSAIGSGEEARTNSEEQRTKDQKLAERAGLGAGEKGTVSEGESKEVFAQEGEMVQSLAVVLEGPAPSPTAGTSPVKAMGLPSAEVAVSTQLLGSHQHWMKELRPEANATLVNNGTEGSQESHSEFVSTNRASELVGTGEGGSFVMHAEVAEERRESTLAQAETEVVKRVDSVVAVAGEDCVPGNSDIKVVKQEVEAAGETGSEAKQLGKKPRVKKLRKRLRSVTKKTAQESEAEPSADAYLDGPVKALELAGEQTEITVAVPVVVIANEAAGVENGASEGLEESKLEKEAAAKEAIICEGMAEGAIAAEPAFLAVYGPGKAGVEVEAALVEQNGTAPESALEEADVGFQDAESFLDEGTESLSETADSLIQVVDGKKGEALQGRTSVVSVLENEDEMEGDEASDWRMRQIEEKEKLEVGDAQRWGIGWDLAEAPGQWKTDEAPEGWSAGDDDFAGQPERPEVEETWSMASKAVEDGDEEIWSSTVTSLQEDGDISEEKAPQEGESVEESIHTSPQEAVLELDTAVMSVGVGAMRGAGAETEIGAQVAEDWSDAATWHLAVEPERLSLEKDEVALQTDAELLEADAALSELDCAGLERADNPLLMTEGAALELALETVPIATEFCESLELSFKKIEETAVANELVGSSVVEVEPVRQEPVAIVASEPYVATAEKETVAERDGSAGRVPFSEDLSNFLEEEMVGELGEGATPENRAVLGVKSEEPSEDWTDGVLVPGGEDRGIDYVEGGSLLNGVELLAGGTTGSNGVKGGADACELIEEELVGQAASGALVEKEEDFILSALNCKADLPFDDPVKVRTLAVRGEWPLVAAGEASGTQVAEDRRQVALLPPAVERKPADSPRVLAEEPAAPQVIELGKADDHAPSSKEDARFFVEEPEEFALVLAAGAKSPRVAGGAEPEEVRVVEVEVPEVDKHVISESLKKREVWASLPAPEDDVSSVGTKLGAAGAEVPDDTEKICVGGSSEGLKDGPDGAGLHKGVGKRDGKKSQDKLKEGKSGEDKRVASGKGGRVGLDWQLNGLVLPANAVEVLLAGGKTVQSAEVDSTGRSEKPGLALKVSKNPLYDADVCPSPGANAPGLSLVLAESPRLTAPTTVSFVARNAAAPVETRAHKMAEAETGKVQTSGTGVEKGKAKRRSGAKRKEVKFLEMTKVESEVLNEVGGRALHVDVWGWWDSLACERTAAVIVILWVIALIVAVLAYLERERSGAAGKPVPT